MVEVNYVDSHGVVRRHVVKAWWLARAIAKNAVQANATQIRLRRIRVDIWLVDPETRTIYCAYQRVMLSQAARVSRSPSSLPRDVVLVAAIVGAEGGDGLAAGAVKLSSACTFLA